MIETTEPKECYGRIVDGVCEFNCKPVMTIYVHGCTSCGVTGSQVRKVKEYARSNGIEVFVKNSKYDEDARMDHAYWLMNADMSVDRYAPIIVNNGSVLLLSLWI